MKVEGMISTPLNPANNIEYTSKQPEQEKAVELSKDLIIKSIEKVNEKLLLHSPTELRVSVHEKTKQIMLKIVDCQTQEVVKEIPSEKLADMIAKFMELNGVLVDEKI